jgi:hypothetical protein
MKVQKKQNFSTSVHYITYVVTQKELEMERTKVQNIDILINQIKQLTSPGTPTPFSPFSRIFIRWYRFTTGPVGDDADENERRAMLKKLLDEKEAHSHTLQLLNEARKKAELDR